MSPVVTDSYESFGGLNMQVDVLNSFPVNQVPSLLPGNPSQSTVWRWLREGVPGPDGKQMKLASYKVGHRRFVTRDAIDAFILASNGGTSTKSFPNSVECLPPGNGDASYSHAG